MSPWRVILATMVIFGCGVVTGGLLMRTAGSQQAASQVYSEWGRPNSSTNAVLPFAQIQRLEFLHRVQKQLDLTINQRDQIAHIMHESQERSRPLWEKIGPQMREEVRRVHEEIRQVLTPEQQKKMEELLRPHQKKLDSATTNSRTGHSTATNSP